MKLWDTLLLIGGPDSGRPLLREIFQSEYNLLEAEGLEQGMFLLEQNCNCIAAIIVDRPPPKNMDDSFLHAVRQQPDFEDIPILTVIVPSDNGHMEELAFSLGSSDVVSHPIIPSIIHQRVHILVDLFRNRQRLLSTLNTQAETIRHTNEVMVDALSAIIEYRSAESGSHILRIRRFTEILLKEVVKSCPEYGLTPADVSNISSAAALHDIGKISIPDYILNKPDKLTPEEFEIIKTHTTTGSQMIQALSGATSEEYLRYAYNICRYHHERWNGDGYPEGLVGDAIPICAQVVSVADVFDALASNRIYKDAYPPATAANMILNGECGRFSPKLLNCFKRVVKQFIDLVHEYANGHSPKDDSIALPLPSPFQPNYEIDSLQIAQLKYQALLHYTSATVIEVDLDHSIFHVVYNPLPNFQPLPNILPLENALDAAALTQVHPDDVEQTLKEYQFLTGEFFSQGLRRHSFSHRIYSSTLNDYRRHQVTFLRLDTGDFKQRKAILIWQPITPLPVVPTTAGHNIVQENAALLLLTSNVLCRNLDYWFTFVPTSGNLLDLLGYTRAEIRDQFHDHFLELVLPEDRDALRTHIVESLNVGNRVESEYRMRHKDGRILWILEKGCVVTAEEGQDYFYGILIDNTQSHKTQAELEDALHLNRLIVEQSDDIIFDWDMVNNNVNISPNWQAILGYDPTVILHSDTLSLSRIHPDDLSAVSALGKNIHTSCPVHEVELRIANHENQYLWFRMRLTALTDANGNTYRALGTLTNIDASKRAYLSLQMQAQQDSLTGLLNKASSQAAIRAYLDSPDHTGSALLMLDLDNFKGINDRFGHLFGDTVLTRTAHAIRRMFRGGDIIGRVGGDEFMVLMKNVTSEHLVQERCQLLLQELSDLFAEDSLDFSINCSIGVALSPVHGTAFQKLFKCADQALYHAKQCGKHRFMIYRNDLDIHLEQLSTPIDPINQTFLANDGLIRAVFQQLSHSTDLDRTIQDVLKLVGQRTNVSRVYIFENNDENTHCSNTFEWCNKGISPEIDNLQNLSYETDIPGWEGNYDENGILFCTDIAQLSPSAQAVLEPQGIKSLLHCAIYENDVFRGYIGLDECDTHRIWTKEQVDILVFLSEVVASFLLRKRAQDKAAAMTMNLHNILGTLRHWVYVVDPETYQLCYINDKSLQTIPSLRVGDVCHKAIMKEDTPCADCPIRKMNCDGYAKSQLFSQQLQIPLSTEAHMVRWDGRAACMVVCREPD